MTTLRERPGDQPLPVPNGTGVDPMTCPHRRRDPNYINVSTPGGPPLYVRGLDGCLDCGADQLPAATG